MRVWKASSPMSGDVTGSQARAERAGRVVRSHGSHRSHTTGPERCGPTKGVTLDTSHSRFSSPHTNDHLQVHVVS